MTPEIYTKNESAHNESINTNQDILENLDASHLNKELEKKIIPKIIEAREGINRKLAELELLNTKVHEMSPKLYSLKKDVLEVETLSKRGEIFSLMRELGIPEEEYETVINRTYESEHMSSEKILTAESPQEKREYEQAKLQIEKVVDIIDGFHSNGMTHENSNSNYWQEKIKTHEKDLEKMDQLVDEYPNLALDLFLNRASQFSLEVLISSSLPDASQVSARKLVEHVIPRISERGESFSKVEDAVTQKVLSEKRKLISQLPLNESFELIKQTPDLLSSSWSANSDLDIFNKRLENHFGTIINEKNFSANAKFVRQLESAGISINKVLPEKLRKFSFNEKDVKSILVGKMPYWIADDYWGRFAQDPELSYLACDRDSSYNVHTKLKEFSSGRVNQESFLKILSQSELEFSSLNRNAKRTALLALDDDAIKYTFTVDDFKDLFDEGSFAVVKIPNEIAPELRQEAITYFFQQGNNIDLHDFELLINKFECKPTDLNSSQVMSCMETTGILRTHNELFSRKDFSVYLANTKSFVPIDYIPEKYRQELREGIVAYAKRNLSVIAHEQNHNYFDYFDQSDFETLINSRYISLNEIPAQYRESLVPALTSKAQESLTSSYIPNPDVLRDGTIRNKAVELVDNAELVKINSGFKLIESPETLPGSVQEKLRTMTERHGRKGERLVALAASVYGLENEADFIKRFEKIEVVINNYDPEKIPNRAHVSLGIEYEVGKSIAGDNGQYTKDTALNYKTSIGMLNAVGDIRSGLDGVHEIAVKPTDNPYLLIAEVKLLQDAGMLDFNFSRYPNASRGYHLSLGAESGMYAHDPNARFIYNALTMTGNTGLLIGKEVGSVKSIHSKSLDQINGNNYKGDRVEFKGMGCDSFEQFERSVLFAHNSGIGHQIEMKILGKPLQDETLNRVPDSLDQFDSFLTTTVFANNNTIESEQEKKILFEWLSLKKQMNQAVQMHNESFIESEFYGTIMTPNGEYKELDLNNNYATKRISYFGKDVINVQAEQEKYKIDQDLFSSQKTHFVNAITRANNLLVFKEPVLNPNKFDHESKRIKKEWMGNAPQLLNAMQGEGYQKDISGTPTESIFDRGGEIRDGYYPIQGTSEYMITHRSQIILNRFNKQMRTILEQSPVRSSIPQGSI